MPHKNSNNDYVLKSREVQSRLAKDGIKARAINGSSYNENSGCFFSEDEQYGVSVE